MADGSFGPDTHGWLDGEPGVPLSDAERLRAERLAEAARTYGEGLGDLDARLDDAVMAAVRRMPAPRRREGWRWVLEPQVVRIRPLWVPAALAAALVLWLVPRALIPVRTDQGAAPVVVVARDTVYVHFALTAPGARTVAVAGSFNGWRPEALPMRRDADGVWSTTIPLALGEYHYQFVVDGERWVSDPTAHALEDDGFGGRNSVIVVGPKGVVRS